MSVAEPLTYTLNPASGYSSVNLLTPALPAISHCKTAEEALRGAAERLIATAIGMIDEADAMKDRG